MPQLFGLARLGRDAEVRFTTASEPVASLSLAFNYGKKGSDGKRPAQWVDGALWGKLAEALAPYLLKGTQVAVTLDDVHIETFDKRDGGQGFKLAGRVSHIELASGGESRAAAQAPAPASRPPARAAAPAAAPATAFDGMDDDIPF